MVVVTRMRWRRGRVARRIDLGEHKSGRRGNSNLSWWLIVSASCCHLDASSVCPSSSSSVFQMKAELWWSVRVRSGQGADATGRSGAPAVL